MIHIIRYQPTDNNILSRKAHVLVDKLGWSISGQASLGAFLNYSFPYLDYRNNITVPFAAYFTHREDCIPGKVQIWEEQAKKAVLRITSAQQYYDDLSRYGPTVKILPPLDRDKFVIKKDSLPNKVPVVGVAGYVYKGGRKGEALLAEVAKRLSHFNFRAMGQGWPVPTVMLPFNQIQSFYQDIDIFLCTSLIEGIPYPPLEALACGKKIVVPWGVGLLDELPSVVGIERYEAGNVKDMEKAILRANDCKANHKALRSVTEIFSNETWAEGHYNAFAEYEKEFVFTISKARKKRLKDRGIYVVANGDNARRCARRLINSMRMFMPNVQVAVVSDKIVPEADINIACPENMDVGGRVAKLSIYELAPKEWKYVIYLDSDTEIMEDISFMFDCLEKGWEMVLTKDVNSRHTAEFLFRKQGKDDYDSLITLIGLEKELAIAGGVWAFKRCKASKQFLNGWLKEWGKGQYRDQISMLRSLYKNQVKALFLGNDWNSFTKLKNENRFEIIRHYSGAPARMKSNPDFSQQAYLIVNNSNQLVTRAGKVFQPGENTLSGLTESQRRQIKACSFLSVSIL